MRRSLLLSFIHVLAFMAWFSGGYAQEPSTRTLELQARQRVAKAPGSNDFEVVQKQLAWDPAQTALVVCDIGISIGVEVPHVVSLRWLPE